MRKHLFAILVSLLCYAPAHIASANDGYIQMKGEALRDVFTNTMVLSEYRTFKGLKGKTYDFTEFHNENGTTEYVETGSTTEIGQWKIIGNDKVCYKYPHSRSGQKTFCFFIYENNKCFYNYGLSAMSVKGPRSWDLWTSRFVRKGAGGICGAPTS